MAAARVLVLISMALLATACAGSGFAPRRILGPDEWPSEIEQRGLDPSTMANPLAYTDEMHRQAQDAAGEGEDRDRLSRLQTFLFERGDAFDYDTFATGTAIEAFESRTGNCVAITSLFIAMSRSLGIPATPALLRAQGEIERDGELMLVKNHIVALLYQGGKALVYDFYRFREGELIGIRPIDDLWLAAIYWSNHGVEALRQGDLDGADLAFEAAIRLAPAYAAAYGNLAVVHRRRGDLNKALDVYLVAIQIDPHNDLLRTNLLGVLLELAEGSGISSADEAGSKVDALMARADAALVGESVRKACRLYRRAHRRDEERVGPLVATGRCELVRGDVGAARRWLDRAVAVDPENVDAKQLLDGLNRMEAPPPEWSVDRVE